MKPPTNHKNRPNRIQSLDTLYSQSESLCTSLTDTKEDIQTKYSEATSIAAKAIREVYIKVSIANREEELASLGDEQYGRFADDIGVGKKAQGRKQAVKGLCALYLLYKEFNNLSKRLHNRLCKTLTNGLCMFCVSLIELTDEQVEPVIDYAVFIEEQREALQQQINHHDELNAQWVSLTSDMLATTNNLEDLGPILEDFQETFDKIIGGIKEWIQRDREYPSLLVSCSTQWRSAVQDLHLEMTSVDESKQQRMEKKKHCEGQMNVYKKRQRQLKTSLANLKRAQNYNENKRNKESSENSSTETQPPSTDDARKRRNDILNKEQDELKELLSRIEKKMQDLENELEEEQEEPFADKIASIQEEISRLEGCCSDCRMILSKHGRAQTMLQLQRDGQVSKGAKGNNLHLNELNCKRIKIKLKF